MNFGFNSNVRVGDTLYHVQTEDRGAGHPFIDTTVYAQGRVLHRRTSGYQDLLAAGSAGLAALEQRVERQHREVIEQLRAGSLPLSTRPAARGTSPAMPEANEPSASPTGIAVQLLNPASWLVAGAAQLEIEVRKREDGRPAAGAEVEATIQGAAGLARFAARSDSQGRAALNFPLPALGPDGAALVIRASSSNGQDEIRYQLRPKPRAPAPAK